MDFFGRQDLLRQLGELWLKRTSSFVTCRGRRRIGKSTLIERFAEKSGARLFVLEGMFPQPRMSNADQLAAFGRQLGEQMGLPPLRAESWFDAFRFLEGALKGCGRTVVLLDEISWMGKYDPNFAGELKYAWDRRFRQKKDLVFVACGSVSSWIRDNILASTGFVGRVSLDLTVGELPLEDCVRFWGRAAARVSEREILDLVSVTGGVPKYLEEMIPSLSTDENIRRMCFTPNGYLFGDFEDIFASVFGTHAPLKRNILLFLSKGDRTRQEIAEGLSVFANGQLSDLLDELVLAGFVEYDSGLNPETGRPAKVGVYRLKDNYARFYLRYIFPHRAEILSGRYQFATFASLPEWNAVAGLQFENLVRNNVRTLFSHLRLDGVQILSAGPFRKRAKDRSRGVQIDLLIQTPRAVYVVEIKRKGEIGEEIEAEVAEKVRRLQIRQGISVRTVLVYDGVLAKSVRGSGFFDALISAAELLGRAG